MPHVTQLFHSTETPLTRTSPADVRVLTHPALQEINPYVHLSTRRQFSLPPWLILRGSPISRSSTDDNFPVFHVVYLP